MPAGAVAAVLNVTVVGPAADAFATVFPCGQPVPTASNVNYRAGVDIANAVVVKLGTGGKACIYTFAATHLLADVNGYITGLTSADAPSVASTGMLRGGSRRVTNDADQRGDGGGDESHRDGLPRVPTHVVAERDHRAGDSGAESDSEVVEQLQGRRRACRSASAGEQRSVSWECAE